MKRGETRDLTTLTVLGSQSLIRPDGRAAILFRTAQAGSIAFEVDERAIAALRKAIAEIETALKGGGKA